MQIVCFSPFGYEGTLVNVEVDLRRGIPAVDIVGLADSAVKESRERMKSAIVNSGFPFPPERVLISLSPADLKKEGAGFDLAIALAVLSESSYLPNSDASPTLVLGELELNGRVRPVRAVHAAAATAYGAGIRRCIVSEENADEAREVRGMEVYGAAMLSDAFQALKKDLPFTAFSKDDASDDDFGFETEEIDGVLFEREKYEFSEVYGQRPLIRALEIAAAGGHNLLVFGPPGCGKTLSLQRFPSLLPLLTKEESQSTTRIYSVAGLLPPSSKGIRRAPFRQPHQSATIEGMCGGGVRCTPGEVSLAHNGVLFLDEAAEFKTSVLQALRVPLETGYIRLSRAGRSTVFPASCQLLMSMNPCPCGNYGSRDKVCLCSAHAIEQYWKRLSAPLLDRVDIRVRADKTFRREGEAGPANDGESTDELRRHIARAVRMERARGVKNARLTLSQRAKYCPIASDADEFLNETSDKLDLSPRAVSSCIKIARTICDMEGKDELDLAAVQEAVRFRKPDGMNVFL